MKLARLFALLVAVLAMSLFAVACGDDEESDSGAGETAQTETPAEKVTLTADDTPKYTFDLSTTPTAETDSVEFKNVGKQFHVMIFARINEGFTLDEAVRMQGEGGSATVVAEAEAGPGQTKTVQVTRPIKPGDYAMLCPIGGPQGPHYKLGQLEEFTIE